MYMINLSDSKLEKLKVEKLNLYWGKYLFLRKRIHKDILFLFTEFEHLELINLLHQKEFDGKLVYTNLLSLMKIIESFEETIIEKSERGDWFFNKVRRTISNKSIIDDIDKLYNSLTFQTTRNLEI
jgi:hypothetical protein